MTHRIPQQPKKKRTELMVAGAAAGLLVILGSTAIIFDGEEEATPRPEFEVTLIEGPIGEGPTLPNLLPPTESELPR